MNIYYYDQIEEMDRKILKEKQGCIYLYVAEKSGENGVETLFYIGRTKRPVGRLFEHFKNIANRGYYQNDSCVCLQNATRFRAYILEQNDDAILDELESKYIRIAEKNFGYGLINSKKTILKDEYNIIVGVTYEEEKRIENNLKDCLFDYLGFDCDWFAANDFLEEIDQKNAKEILQKIEINQMYED